MKEARTDVNGSRKENEKKLREEKTKRERYIEIAINKDKVRFGEYHRKGRKEESIKQTKASRQFFRCNVTLYHPVPQTTLRRSSACLALLPALKVARSQS